MSFRNPLVAPVTVAGPVTVETTGTPGSVTQTGAATTLSPPAGTPTAAARGVSASSQAAASQTNVGSSTLIAAPGVAKVLELHQLAVNGFNNASQGRGQLQRSDTSALLWDSGPLPVPVSGGANGAWVYDFQGAQLPANVGVKLVIITGDANTVFAATLVYNVLS